MLEDLIHTRNRNLRRIRLVPRIRDHTLVDNHSPATVAASHSSVPGVVLREARFRVGKKQLHHVSARYPRCPREKRTRRTTSSLHTPLTFPQAHMTQGSLCPMHATQSTPFSFSSSRLCRNGGRCRSWQDGVKAPWTEKRTTFLPAHSSDAL